MSLYHNLLMWIPEVKNPEKKGTLKQRLYWTFGILVLFLFLASVPLFGVSSSQEQYFKTLELLFGAKIGMLLTLGIGPIVTSSIVLQLLKGSGILKFDLSTEKDQFTYTNSGKLLTFIFILLEAFVYVAFGAVTPASANLFWIVVLELALGGFIVFYMDEVVKNWGLGSGVSLFIAAGIGSAVFLQLFSPLTQTGTFGWPVSSTVPVGKIWAGLYYLSHAQPVNLFTSVIGPVGITIALFFIIVFFQSINVEIPLSFGRIRGQSIKWPLNFFYSGVIPVILISALGANLELWSRLFQSFAKNASSNGFIRFISYNILGQYQGQSPISGLVNWIQPVQIWTNLSNLLSVSELFHIFIYILFMILGSTLFAYFWVQTAGLDSRSQAKNILGSGLQIPGFRKDERIIMRVLDRYILPLTIMGGIGIGFLAASANLLSALTSGTGILLLIMIIYQFYEELAKESMDDFALLRRFMKK